MCFRCYIVPDDVLRRFEKDKSLPAERRKIFADTRKIDAEMRRLRAQASKLARVGAAPPASMAAAPSVTVYNCNHGQSLPGVQVSNPSSSADPIATQVFAETGSVYRVLFEGVRAQFY